MIFVDTNVFMYAVGRPHPLQASAQDFFVEAHRQGKPLCTSAEVMQELAHVYLPAGRLRTFDATLELMASAAVEVWPLEAADVALARQLYQQHPCRRGTSATGPVVDGVASETSKPLTGSSPL